MSLYDIVKNSGGTYLSLAQAMAEVTTRARFPAGAVFELSPICNFKCPFCYARVSQKELDERGERVLRFEDWKRLIDEIHALSVCDLTLTGGECMLHPDFLRIYRYAYEKGFLITLMTNGSCVTPAVLELFGQCPPEAIYLTVYGASPETYAAVCGDAAYYDRVMKSIRAIKALGIQHFVLQCTVDRDNVGDLKQIYDLAKELGLPLRYTPPDLTFRRVTAEMLEDCVPDKEALDAASGSIYADKHAFDDENIAARKKEKVFFSQLPVVEKGIPCGAGRRSFAINYRGEMIPCVSLDFISIPTEGRDLGDCWRQLTAACDEVPRLTECVNCIFKTHCKSCIALHYNDVKRFGVPSPRLCYKKLHPERAAELEAKYARDGYLLREDME